MILNNVENIYIGDTQVEKVMFNLVQIWPQLQNAGSNGSSSGGNSDSESGSSGSGSSGGEGNSGSG